GVLFFLACEFHGRADLILAKKGKTAYSIVIASNAIPSERYAAQELQHYLKKISGAELPIITDAHRSASKEIILGDNARVGKLGVKSDYSKLGTDGFTLLTKGNRLFILGGKPRGTLYGAYALLEEKLGVRWFTPELEVVPSTSKVVLTSPLDETQIP